MRRVPRDLTGDIPTANQAREFLDESAPDQRQRLLVALGCLANVGVCSNEIEQTFEHVGSSLS